MKKGCVALLLSVFLALAAAVPRAGAVDIKMPFVFTEQFQENAQPLGFPEGRIIQIGALINPGDTPLAGVTATNLDTGVVLEPAPLKTVDKFFSGIYMVMPMPTFDPEKHLGVWEIAAVDENGGKAAAKAHRLDKTDALPYLKDIKAAGDPLTPTINWKAYEDDEVPEWCKVGYHVRLLKDVDHQLHRSKFLTEASYDVPEGVLKEGDVSDVYIKVESACFDAGEPKDPMALELRSGSFKSLKEASGR